MQWDPQQYAIFADERGRPFADLLARVDTPTPPRTVVDLGCGPGELTAQLARRWPAAHVTGVDSSPEMVARAAAHAVEGRLRFELGDVRDWAPETAPDVIVANALLQWVPGHLRLLPRLLAVLAPGGRLALQVPGNVGSPSHALMREAAASPRWAGRLEGVLRHEDAVGEPADYLRVLSGAGAEADVWETTYTHVLSGPDPVLEWVRGTGLRPVLAALGPDAAAFEAEYAALLRAAYPATELADELVTLLPFRRVFAVARMPGAGAAGAAGAAGPGAVTGLHHVQLACPPGSEPASRAFYRDLLGMAEVAKPPVLAARGGAWFRSGSAELHLGVEAGFVPARKAHPGVLVDDLDAVVARLRAAGVDAVADGELPGFRRCYVEDPNGNRLELVEPGTCA